MDSVTSTGTDRRDMNHRLGLLAMSALFTQDQIIEICLVAKERGVSAIEVIREAVLGTLY